MRTLLLALLLVARCALAQLDDVAFVGSLTTQSTAAFAPTDISGLVRWYDAQSIAGKNDGDRISVWTDKTGNSNLTNAVSNNQPVYLSSVSDFGNKACVHFMQTNASEPQWLASVNLEDSSKTVFAVVYRVDSDSRFLMSFTDVSAIVYNDSIGPWSYYNTTGGSASAGSAQSVGVIIAKFSSLSSLSLRSQSGAWATGDPDDSYDNAGQFVIATSPVSGSPLDCYVGEILTYDSPLTDSDVNRAGAYLASRWNFTWTDL